MQWVKLGDFIDSYKERSGDTNAIVSGVDINKQFIATRANLEEVDVSKYYKVPPMHFACNLMHIGRDERIPIALNETNKVLVVTSAYYVFKVKDNKLKELLPEYLYVFFNTPEKDRLAWFYTDSSVRGNLTENRFKDIEIPLPSIDEQKQVVAAWRGLKNLGEQNEQMAGPLMDLCQSYLQDLKHKYPLVEIGPYIEEITDTNADKKYGLAEVRGVSNDKTIRDYKGSLTGRDLSKFLVIKNNEFVFNKRTNAGLGLGFNETANTYIFTEDYEAFKVISSDLLPQYLYLWLARTEFDRYVAFNSWGSSVVFFHIDDMQQAKIPLPPIEIQRAIVEIYNCAKTSKYISETAKKLNSDICPALMRQIIGDNQ